MKKNKWILILSLATSTALASVDHSGYKFSGYVGLQKNTIKPSPFVLSGNETETLVPNQSNIDEFISGLGIAYRFITPKTEKISYFTHDISLGLDVFYFQTKQNGTVLDYENFPDFSYHLKIKSLRFMGNTEWTFLPITSQNIFPFLEAGIGLVFNTNYYSDTPNPSSSIGVGLTFHKHTIPRFAYDIGAGLKWMPFTNIETSLRYLYSDLGTVRSGTGANLSVENQYTISLKTQSILFGISYLLDK